MVFNKNWFYSIVNSSRVVWSKIDRSKLNLSTLNWKKAIGRKYVSNEAIGQNNVRRCSTVLKERMSEGLRAERAPSDPRPRGRRRSSSNDVSTHRLFQFLTEFLTDCLSTHWCFLFDRIFNRSPFDRLTPHQQNGLLNLSGLFVGLLKRRTAVKTQLGDVNNFLNKFWVKDL